MCVTNLKPVKVLTGLFIFTCCLWNRRNVVLSNLFILDDVGRSRYYDIIIIVILDLMPIYNSLEFNKWFYITDQCVESVTLYPTIKFQLGDLKLYCVK